MRGTIFYTGSRMQAVESAKYYMRHKQKIREIMSSRGQSPQGKVDFGYLCSPSSKASVDEGKRLPSKLYREEHGFEADTDDSSWERNWH